MLSGLRKLADKVFTALINAGDQAYGNSALVLCSAEAGRLASLGDAELNVRHLQRTEVVAHAFRRLPLY